MKDVPYNKWRVYDPEEVSGAAAWNRADFFLDATTHLEGGPSRAEDAPGPSDP